MSKLTNISKKSSRKGSKTDASTPPRYSAISKHSSMTDSPKRIREWLTSLPLAFLANRLASPEKGSPKRTTAINGLIQSNAFAWFDRDSSSWKTSQASLLPNTFGRSRTSFPRQGMTSDGLLWALTMLAPRIGGRGGGVWPTPHGICRTDKSGKRSGPTGNELGRAVNQWPTPRACEGEKPSMGKDRRHQGLTHRIMYPSPLPSDVMGGRTTKGKHRPNEGGLRTWATPKGNDSKNNAAPSQRRRKGPDLNVQAATWPTPLSNASTGPGRQGREGGDNLQTAAQGRLNPDWVEWLMSWPIGWSSLEPMKEFVWLDWSRDPADCPDRTIPRVSTGIKDRVNRLKAIGNGQVPLCVATAYQALIDKTIG